MYSSTVAGPAMIVAPTPRRCVRQQPQPLALVQHRVRRSVGQPLAGKRQLARGRVADQLADHRTMRHHDDGCRSRRGLTPGVAHHIPQCPQPAGPQVRPQFGARNLGSVPVAPAERGTRPRRGLQPRRSRARAGRGRAAETVSPRSPAMISAVSRARDRSLDDDDDGRVGVEPVAQDGRGIPSPAAGRCR